MQMGTGFIWLRIGTSSGLHNALGTSCLSEQLVSPQEGLGFMALISLLFNLNMGQGVWNPKTIATWTDRLILGVKKFHNRHN
jgi:hypothetical protein